MYGGGDLPKLLVQKSPKLKEEEGHKQGYTANLAAHLALLNDLARNDLNFQNLLVLQNIFSLGMEVEVTKILNDAKRITHTNEILHSSGRQRNHNKQHHKPHPHVYDNANKMQASCSLSDVVMGYPARECSTPPDQHNKWGSITGEHSHYASSRDASQWTSSHYPSGDEADVRSGSHQMESCSNVDERLSEGVENERFEKRMPSAFTNYTEENRTRLLRCKSWPDPLGSSTPSSDQESHEKECYGFYTSDGEIIEYPSFMRQHDEEEEIGLKSDLERFMEAATPKLTGNTKSPLTMDDIWEFYELPSVYGLQVPFFKGSKGVSLAHFVPSLSAIRLFIPASPVKNEGEGNSSPELYLCETPGFPRYLKLIFEFFEELVPHVRPPLSTRLKEFVCAGTSESQIPNLPLRDVHPASWFAVAWYPVYCIPEGKLRTTFLTFHSFGSSHQSFDSSARVQKMDSKAPLIGIKFLSLSKDAWLVPTRRHNFDIVYSNVHAGTSSERGETENNNGHISSVKSTTMTTTTTTTTTTTASTVTTTTTPKSETLTSIKNGVSVLPVDRRSVQHQKDLERRTDSLQSNAENLARAHRLRVMCGSGTTIEPARCWHSDFEFFCQRG